MAEVIIWVAVIIFLIVLLGSDEIAKILGARKSKTLGIEHERTEQKRLELEIAKVNAGLKSSLED